MIVSGILLLIGSRYLPRDLERAAQRSTVTEVS